MKLIYLPFLLAVAFPVMASDTSARSYGRQSTLGANEVTMGIVLYTRSVDIENRQPRMNTGTAIGGAVGYAVARHTDSSVGRLVGTTLGGVVGTSIQQHLGNRKGIEVFVRNEEGKTISVVQDDDQSISVGQPVLLVGRKSEMRVVPIREPYE